MNLTNMIFHLLVFEKAAHNYVAIIINGRNFVAAQQILI